MSRRERPGWMRMVVAVGVALGAAHEGGGGEAGDGRVEDDSFGGAHVGGVGPGPGSFAPISHPDRGWP